jgi:hypothetical protein
MSGAVSNMFGLMVPHRKLEACIKELEEGLRSLKRTPYHKVMGKDFLDQASNLADWLIAMHQQPTTDGKKPAAIYVEMNGFTINPKQWHCDLFGYKKAGDIWDLDWLSAWDTECFESFVLHGMEPVQEAFAKLFLKEKKPLGVKMAEEVAEHLVTARFMQLVAAAHKVAKRKYPPLKGCPVLATAHDWDVAHQTE